MMIALVRHTRAVASVNEEGINEKGNHSLP